ncbi:BBE domain-containing protein [Clostridium neuense]|uniref:BBE domain-containing protein n=1 Tax=Clostridium neuense TaxID=1728934 RepID=A0ABW8TJX1_9CLOT
MGKNDNERLYTDWVSKVFKYVEPITKGSYVNFPYAELQNYGCEYYGKNYYYLRKVKTIYDPLNIFKFPQSIKPNLP